jgi:hypothetical protein
MKVLVTGGRDYTDFKQFREVIAKLKPDFLVFGDCPTGLDAMAYSWARWLNIPHQQYCADWKNFGLAAGPMRNQQMIQAEKPDLVVAFPGGKGTADTVRRAHAAGIPVQLIEPAPNPVCHLQFGE